MVYSQIRNGPETGNLEQEVRDISNGGLMDEDGVQAKPMQSASGRLSLWISWMFT
jgi:hypothetical protein